MIKLAIFDMDGTIFESYLDWKTIKQHLNIEANILKEINYGDKHKLDRKKLAILEKYESEHTRRTKPIKGIHDFIAYLKSRQITAVLLTNNNGKNTRYLVKKHGLDFCFNYILTRESGMYKPDNLPFKHIFKRYDCVAEEVISIGDSHYDIIASKNAGIKDIFIICSAGSDQLKLKYPRITLFSDYLHLKTIFTPAVRKS